MTKLLFLAGSARQDSWNKQLAKEACALAESKGAVVSWVDLKDYPMPLYDGDVESAQGIPENAKKLKALFAQQDGIFIASPEYNGSFSPLLKNTIDWLSRPSEESEAPLIAFKDKVAEFVQRHLEA
jgi:NAD(P)H-dependent FMN reductase